MGNENRYSKSIDVLCDLHHAQQLAINDKDYAGIIQSLDRCIALVEKLQSKIELSSD